MTMPTTPTDVDPLERLAIRIRTRERDAGVVRAIKERTGLAATAPAQPLVALREGS